MKKIVNLNDELMETIATYMDDEIREDIHHELSPCTNEEFLEEYCKRDEDFIELLENEFYYIF